MWTGHFVDSLVETHMICQKTRKPSGCIEEKTCNPAWIKFINGEFFTQSFTIRAIYKITETKDIVD